MAERATTSERAGAALASTRAVGRRLGASLQTRLYALVLIAILPVLAFQTIGVVSTLRAREAEAHAEVLRLAEALAGEVDRIVDGERAALEVLARSPTIANRRWDVCDAFLVELTAAFPQTIGHGVLDRDGQLVCTSHPSPNPDYSNRPYFRDARETGRFTVGGYAVGRATQRPFLGLSLPLRDAAGEFDGVVFTGLDLAWLTEYLSRRSRPDGGAINVLDREGVVLVRVPPVEGVVGTEVDAPVLPLLGAAESGTSDLVNRQGHAVIFGFVPVPQPPEGLFVTASVGRNELMAGYRAAAVRNLAILVAGLAFGLVAASLLWRGSVKGPLDRLEAVLDRWRQGDLSPRIATRDGSELGQLGELLDGMAATLQRRGADVAAERERLGLVADAVPALVSFVDADRRYRFLNHSYEVWFGRPKSELIGRRMPDLIGEEAYAAVAAYVDGALAGRTQRFERMVRYKDAGTRHVAVQYLPALRDGEVEGFYVFVEDVSEARRAEALQSAQKRALELSMGGAPLAEALDALAAAAADMLGGSVAIFLADSQAGVLRLGAAAGLSDGYRAAIDPLPTGPHEPSCGRAAVLGERVVVPDVTEDPSWAPWRELAEAHGVRACWSTPIRHLGGPSLGVLTVHFPEPRRPSPEELESVDAFVRTAAVLLDRKRAEDHQRLLVGELNHRVKNTMAIVQSIASQTLRDAANPEEGLEAFAARLRALAATHDALTAESWTGADLHDLVAAGVGALDQNAARVSIEGPPLRLPARVAVSMTMALHELATNAVKYGALSTPLGRVEVRWRVEPATDAAGPRLRLVWRERGGPPLAPPSRRGFGTRMLERALAADTQGRVSLDYAPEGLTFELEAPLPKGLPDAG
jgi:PAS domain S-box-containing protein